MRLLARCLQGYFGFAAMLIGFRAAADIFLVIAMRRARPGNPPDLDPSLALPSPILGPLLAAAALFSLVAWWQLKHGRPAAQKWALAASLANLFWFPVGTVAGIVGLLVFSLGDVQKLTPAPPQPRHRPRPGDGTTAFSPVAFTLTGWALTWFGFRFLSQWAVNNGLRLELDRMPPGTSLLTAAVLSVVLHELGHVLGAWACEYSVRGIRVGPFFWLRIQGNSEFRLDLSNCLGGSTVAVPTKQEGLLGRQLFVLAAGPAGSLIFGAISLLMFVTALGRPWQPVWILLEILAVFCLSDAICNLVPVGNREGTYSDGARLWQIALGGEWARYIEFSLIRSLSTTTDFSPADWPSQQVENSVRFAPTPSAKMMEHFMAFSHYRLRGEPEPALNHMREVLALKPQGNQHIQTLLAPELAFYFAWYGGNSADARPFLDQLNRHDADHYRALTAVLGLEGDLDGARQAWQSGWAQLMKSPPNGNRLLDEYDFTIMAERWFPDLVHIAANVRNPVPALPGTTAPVESFAGV